MNKDDGYTLAEALVALATISLALGGLTAAVRMINLNQAAASRTLGGERGLRAMDGTLSTLLAGSGPFRSDQDDGLSGDGTGFTLDCHASTLCAARLARSARGPALVVTGRVGATINLSGFRYAHFVYVGSRTQGGIWPSSSKDPETLRAVVLVGEGAAGAEVPLASARIWKEQGADCVFDPISGGCRKAGA